MMSCIHSCRLESTSCTTVHFHRQAQVMYSLWGVDLWTMLSTVHCSWSLLTVICFAVTIGTSAINRPWLSLPLSKGFHRCKYDATPP